MVKFIPACAAAFLLIGTAAPVYAYLDPGTGSYFLQIVIAGFLGAVFSLKLFWGRIKNFFKRDKESSDK